MNNKSIVIDEDIIEQFNILNKAYHFKIEQKNQNNVDYIIKKIKEELLNLFYCESDICDMLVKHLYSKKTPHKEVLWKCFGDIMVENLKNNIESNSIQCEKCGKRFIPNNNKQKYCNECAIVIKKENDRVKLSLKRKCRK